MARQVMRFSVTVPAGTPIANPQVTPFQFNAGDVEEIEVVVPPGPRGNVGFALGSAGVRVFPETQGAYIVTDGEVVRWALEDAWDSGAWQLFAYNTGNYAHTLEVRFLLGAAGASPSTAAPIDASTLVPVASSPPLPVPETPAPETPLGVAPPPVVAPPVAPPETPPPPAVQPPQGVNPTLTTIPPPVVSAAPVPAPTPTAGGGVTVTRSLPTRMYDSTTWSDIPGGAVMVALYDYVPSSQPPTRDPGRFYVTITKDPTHLDADVIDVEGGAATLDQARAWVVAKQSRGQVPVVYAIGGDHDKLTQMASFYGFPSPARWLAEWDRVAQVPDGYVAKQYANPAITGGHYDVSAVSPTWPGLAAWAGNPTPAPAPVTIISGGVDDMTAQEYAAVVKLSYEVQGLRKTLEAMGRPVPGQFQQDATDPNGFNTQVNAAVSKSLDLHAIVNNITEAP